MAGKKKGNYENLNLNVLMTPHNMLQDVPEELGLAEWLVLIEGVYIIWFFSKMDF